MRHFYLFHKTLGTQVEVGQFRVTDDREDEVIMELIFEVTQNAFGDWTEQMKRNNGSVAGMDFVAFKDQKHRSTSMGDLILIRKEGSNVGERLYQVASVGYIRVR